MTLRKPLNIFIIWLKLNKKCFFYKNIIYYNNINSKKNDEKNYQIN